MPSVAVIGHSNLPEIASWDNFHVETFKVKGARLIELIQQERFPKRLYANEWDYVILFLGGNDIAKCRDQHILYLRFITVHGLFPCKRFLLTDIEPRVYTKERAKLFRIETRQYQIAANVVNHKLKVFAKSHKPQVQMVHVPPRYMIESHDGIHLSPWGTQMLVRRYKAIISAHATAQHQ